MGLIFEKSEFFSFLYVESLGKFVAGRPDSRLGSIVPTKFVENVNYMTFDFMGINGWDILLLSVFTRNCDTTISQKLYPALFLEYLANI